MIPESSSTRREGRDGFDCLLLALDADRDRAGERYEALRRKLVKLFAWRGCLEAEPCADETLDRAGRRLAEGAPVPDVFSFCHGVALNVLREHWRQPERRSTSLDSLPVSLEPAVDPASLAGEREERRAQEARLHCLDSCLGELAPQARGMLTRYHAGGTPSMERRRALARELGIPMNALRIRVHRVRSGLGRCIETCLRRPGGG